jgi:glycosyltransferase involved in cell wall biosynthesis
MRTALVHDWLTGMRGGEKVLDAICRLYPQADLFTLIHCPGRCTPAIENRRIATSWLNRLPAVERYYRCLLPLAPRAIESLNLREYDLIISNSHCVAKGIRRSDRAIHICYCMSPMRYAWSQSESYQRTMGLLGMALALLRGPLRRWDRRSSAGVDVFVAVSRNVADRVRHAYGRHAEVVYPPVDVDFFTPAPVPREPFYLVVGAMAPYKRVDQAVETFRSLPGRELIVIGTGQMASRLRRMAGANVRFLGHQSDESIRDHYRRCRALLFPGEEDFGIVPVEAMACGCPVIAYRAGGAMETVRDGDDGRPHEATGVLYSPQTAEGLRKAIERLERMGPMFQAETLSAWARTFCLARFQRQFVQAVESAIRDRGCAGDG